MLRRVEGDVEKASSQKGEREKEFEKLRKDMGKAEKSSEKEAQKLEVGCVHSSSNFLFVFLLEMFVRFF